MQSRIPAAHVALNAADAETLGLADGALVTVTIDGLSVKLPLQRHAELASGLLAMPLLPGVPFTLTGGKATISGAAGA